MIVFLFWKRYEISIFEMSRQQRSQLVSVSVRELLTNAMNGRVQLLILRLDVAVIRR